MRSRGVVKKPQEKRPPVPIASFSEKVLGARVMAFGIFEKRAILDGPAGESAGGCFDVIFGIMADAECE